MRGAWWYFGVIENLNDEVSQLKIQLPLGANAQSTRLLKLVSLNGLVVVVADLIGLSKTLDSIAFLSQLRKQFAHGFDPRLVWVDHQPV